MKYGSVCSGIEAASVAWESLGWQAAWFAEIEAFPSAVLANHWPQVDNLGDMTKIASAVRAGQVEAPDVLVGGTPCQAFSIAGLRNGLDDARGQLTLSYVELANAIDNKRRERGEKETIIVWENVPGVLSSKDNAFGCFLAGLAGESSELQPPGGKWTHAGCVSGPQRVIAWRVLDAQFFGVAQRRRRVFVVASARADIDPAKILFELGSVRRDTAPSRGAGKAVAALTANGVGTCGADDNQAQAGHLISQTQFGEELAGTLTARHDSSPCADRGMNVIAMAYGQAGAEIKTDDTAPTLTCNHEAPIVFSSNGHASFAPGVGALRAKSGADHETLAVHGTQDPDTLRNLAHTLGRNNGQENAIIAFNSKDNGQDAAYELSPTIRASNSVSSNQNASAPPAFAPWPPLKPYAMAGGIGYAEEQAPTLTSANSGTNLAPTVMQGMSVRRLTPIECERLQGFPDNHTLIPVSKRKQITQEEYAYQRYHNPSLTAEEAYRLAKDGPRYKAIGNSMAVPVMRWIGERIAMALPVAAPEPRTWQRPFLKWAGGKYSLLPELYDLIPAGQRLIEPFVGAGSVFLNSDKHEVFLLADVNADLINLYQMLAVVPELVTACARRMFSHLNTEEKFLAARDEFNAQKMAGPERAAAFLFLNRHCFNGLTRYNLSNHFNVGFGKYPAPYFPLHEINAFAAISHNCVFLNAGFSRTLALAGEGDVVYCDPPYEPLPGTKGFTNYAAGGFTWDDQVALAESCVAAHQRGAKVLISNSTAPRIIDLYEQHGFSLHHIRARRSISSKASTRETAKDIVATLGGMACGH